MAKCIRELNLELGRPTADEALRRLDAELTAAKQLHRPVLKLIHGYGSSGKGGKIRTACRRYLQQQAELGRVRALIPGEQFTIFEEKTRKAFAACPELRADRDLDAENRGVTFVLL